ncbi:hypothetical protein [Bacillus cereus]|uniref:hypothetical protein n=1 Tax=Bacillus cereus TaxID=1396 RepID=UPI000B4AE714|nr:hypothetical protein [Bacillus cereus]
MMAIDGTREALLHWEDKLDFEFVGLSYPTTIIVKTNIQDFTCGRRLYKYIKPLSQYINITYVSEKKNAYIIQFDYDIYLNGLLEALLSKVYKALYEQRVSYLTA